LSKEEKPLVVCAHRVIDIKRESPIIKGCVIIQGNEIKDVGPRGSLEIPKDARIIECSNDTIMPGLIDAHVHVTGFRSGDYIKESLLTPFATLVARGIKDLEAMLDAGYTTIVDAGGIISLQLKDAWREGSIRAPRIVAAGYPISQTFGHGDVHFLPTDLVDARTSRLLMPLSSLLCDGVDECRKAARYALRAGADFIKIFTTGGVASQRDRPEYPQFTLEEIEAIVDEARKVGKFVHAHAEGAKGIVNAIRAGIKRIAHAIYIDEEGIRLAKENEVMIIPTLSVVDLILKAGAESGLPPWAIEKAEEVRRTHINNIRKAYRAGVRLATGTDFFIQPSGMKVYGYNSMEILALINEIGLETLEAIRAATINAAFIAGLEDKVGSLEPGKIADLIVVKGDPIDNPELLLGPDNVVMVIQEVRIVKNKCES
jgi:imidazolonepropionase-like amidohydrolase